MAIHRIEARYEALAAIMDERLRRQWAAAEAQTYGWGGIPFKGRVFTQREASRNVLSVSYLRYSAATPLERSDLAGGGGD
jgi:hypothetical protein